MYGARKTAMVNRTLSLLGALGLGLTLMSPAYANADHVGTHHVGTNHASTHHVSADQATAYSAENDIVGQLQTMKTQFKDTFADIGDSQGIGYLALVNANPGVDPWLPGKGTRITLPTQYILPRAPHRGIVINLAEYRLYYYHGGKVQVFPIGIGTDDNPSPVAHTRVIGKIVAPTWYPPKSIRAEHAKNGDYLPARIPPGPEDPLGPFALQLGVPGYFIHGTNKQFGIGTQVSHGCFRMYNQNITELFKEVPRGAPVHIVNQPIKLGMRGTRLFVEVHRADDGHAQTHLAALKKQTQQLLEGWELQYPALQINHQALENALKANSGVPTRIGQLGMGTMMAGSSSQASPAAGESDKH